jgi:hypothetical protein
MYQYCFDTMLHILLVLVWAHNDLLICLIPPAAGEHLPRLILS